MAHFENILSTRFKVGEGFRRWPNCSQRQKSPHTNNLAAKMLRKARMAALETLRRGVGQGRQWPLRAESRPNGGVVER